MGKRDWIGRGSKEDWMERKGIGCEERMGRIGRGEAGSEKGNGNGYCNRSVGSTVDK